MSAEALRVNERITIPAAELQFSFARSSGPGGQNVNKVESKALLRWQVARSPSLPADVRGRFLARYASRLTTQGELIITSQKTRDQRKNINDCLDRLRQMVLAVAQAPRPRRATKPSRGSKVRRLKEKKARSEVKQGRGSVRRDD